MEENEVYETLKKYEPMMHSLIKRFKIKRDYEDILQELRLETLIALKAYNPKTGKKTGAKLSTFVYCCLNNYLINKLVIDKKNQMVEKDEDMTLNQKIPYNLKYPDYIGDMTFEQQMEVLRNDNSAEAIRLRLDLESFKNFLDERDKAILELKASGLKQREISKETNIPRSTVANRLKYIKERLKYYLQEGAFYG